MADGQGGLFFAYAERIPSDDNVKVQHLDAAGQRLWGSGGVLACGLPSSETIGSFLAPDGEGGVLAFWFSRSAQGDYVGGQRFNGSGQLLWGVNGVRVSPFGFGFTMALTDSQGGAWVSCYHVGAGADWDNYVLRVLPDGTPLFPSPLPVCVGLDRQYGADLNPDGAGGVFLTWLDWRQRGYFEQDIYFQHVRPNGEMVEPLNGSPVTTAPGKQGLTRWWTGADGAGNVFVFWDGEELGQGDPITIFAERIPCGLTSVSNDDPGTPTEFALSQNYPNPFNPITEIGFRIADFGMVSLKVFDLLGREVAALVNEEKSPGIYSASWNATNVGSGVYFARLESHGKYQIMKMLLIR